MQNDDQAEVDIIFLKFTNGSGNWYNDFESSLVICTKIYI